MASINQTVIFVSWEDRLDEIGRDPLPKVVVWCKGMTPARLEKAREYASERFRGMVHYGNRRTTLAEVREIAARHCTAVIP